MDIGALSMYMNQASLQSAMSVSVLKIAMNSDVQATTQMTEMMNNVDVDTNIGMNIDARA